MTDAQAISGWTIHLSPVFDIDLQSINRKLDNRLWDVSRRRDQTAQRKVVDDLEHLEEMENILEALIQRRLHPDTVFDLFDRDFPQIRLLQVGRWVGVFYCDAEKQNAEGMGLGDEYPTFADVKKYFWV